MVKLLLFKIKNLLFCNKAFWPSGCISLGASVNRRALGGGFMFEHGRVGVESVGVALQSDW